MTEAYLCPKCKTNRTRFHQIDQAALPVKLDPRSGEIVETFEEETLTPIHMHYNGPAIRIQCGACGLNEAEETFIAFAKNSPLS
ncbi:DNA alkylation repair protein [Alkalihalobacillus sp. LMS6]|uniref:DNA alkylation repair protein n=1 Tax=Bacillaceae TaxID=186817 RepID=UPI000C07E3F3|nr:MULTISPECIES: DNA alkylation repair protein [Bacillaceae]UTR04646.1 DNA alkylation repair protein [Alkalihalobacillus sp. LMS6]